MEPSLGNLLLRQLQAIGWGRWQMDCIHSNDHQLFVVRVLVMSFAWKKYLSSLGTSTIGSHPAKILKQPILLHSSIYIDFKATIVWSNDDSYRIKKHYKRWPKWRTLATFNPQENSKPFEPYLDKLLFLLVLHFEEAASLLPWWIISFLWYFHYILMVRPK